MRRSVGPPTRLLAAALLWLGATVAQGAEPVEVYARGDYAGVVKLLEPRHRAGAAKIQERLLLARAYIHLDRADDGLAVLRAVLAADRENPEANSLMGQTLLAAGKHKDAIPCLEHAVRLKPDPATTAALGRCHYALGDRARAKVHLEKALKHDIRDPSNSLVLGKICLERGLGAQAEKHLLLAQEAGLETRELHLLLGRAYVLQRKLVGPIRVLRIPKPPAGGDVVEGHVVVGRLEGVADRYKVCSRFSALYEGLGLLKAGAREPDALAMVAAGWLAVRQIALAEKALAELETLDPGSRRVVELRAELLLVAGRAADLEKHLDAATTHKRLEARALAHLYYRAALERRAAGERGQATRLLEKAERQEPTSAKVLGSLAGLMAAAGRRRDAARYYTRMVELFPDAPDVDQWRNALRVLEQQKGADQ